MNNLYDWAKAWRVPVQAVHDLERRMAIRVDHSAGEPGRSESNVQSRVRLEAANKGLHLWRNNVGGCVDEHGNHIRYGLANDSAKMNKVIKSSDLIGIRPRLVTPDMVGQRFGQFVAREIKAEGWYYTGTDREEAQRRFIELVVSLGGDAQFCAGEGSL